MGWLKIAIDVVLQVSQLSPFATPYDDDGPGQKPLPLPLPPVITPGVDCPAVSCPGRTEPFTCSYPDLEAQGWEFCNGPDSRDCWMRDPSEDQPSFTQWDVRTNYEKHTPPGVVREYWLEVNDNEALQPDGVEKVLGKYFNGTYPGPLLEACWGDTIVAHVRNARSDNGTTVHWHGIRMLHSNEMDGVNGITQCPISTGDSFTYKFNATQYGHSWYHSHYSTQYGDGVAGPLVIYGPSSANWDIDLGPIMVTDWVHETAFLAYEAEMRGLPPNSSSILVNGLGHYRTETANTGSYFQTCFTPGKKHLLRLINSGVAMNFVFSIDDHNLTVVSADLVAIEPFEVEALMVGIGQRYSVIVQAKDEPRGEYWIRTVPSADGCSHFDTDKVPAPDNRTAVVKYDGASNSCPPDSHRIVDRNECHDTAQTLLKPIVPWCVDQHAQNNVTDDTYHATIQDAPDAGLGPPGRPYRHWILDERPMWLDFQRPTILHVDGSLRNPNYTVIEEDYADDGYVYLIIDASKFVAPIHHPLHLHGSDFVILAQTHEAWDPHTSPAALFRYDNPPRRDVAMLPGGGFIALAFRPDNPGAWLLHCHIAWHASSGLALQVLIRPKADGGGGNDDDDHHHLADTRRVCDAWAASGLGQTMHLLQDDSGI